MDTELCVLTGRVMNALRRGLTRRIIAERRDPSAHCLYVGAVCSSQWTSTELLTPSFRKNSSCGYFALAPLCQWVYQRILLPTDGSIGAEHAAPHAFTLAEAYDAAIHILSVVDLTGLGPDVRTALLIEQHEESAQTAVDALVAQAKEHGIADVTGTVMTGTPHQAILDYVDTHDIDVLVMSTHGRSGLDRYLLGSVTEKICRTAPIPVLTVRMAEEPDADA